jgi:hypothetical protein
MDIERIARKAEELGNDPKMMKSYRDFYNNKGYFLTKNPDLKGSSKISKFPTTATAFVKAWDSYTNAQKKYLLDLADVKESQVNLMNYEKFRNANKNLWPNGYFVVYYSTDSIWACNLFIGEALFKAGYNFVNANNKYYSAKQIWNGEGPFKLVDKKDVKRGHIAAFGGHHVEIVTKVNKGQKFFDDDFCSRGAGRGSSDFGTEKCEGIVGSTREIDNEQVRFLTIR